MPWAPAYASAAELRSFIADGTSGSEDELSLAIETASRSVDRATNRQFGKVDESQPRWYEISFDSSSPPQRRWTVEVDDIMTTTGLVVEFGNGAEVSGVPLNGVIPTPVNAVINGRPWTKLLLPQGTSAAMGQQVRVTGSFGWAAVPDAIKLATMIQASRLFARRHAPFGILGSPETGGELRLLERLDADLITSVRPYVRMWGAV